MASINQPDFFSQSWAACLSVLHGAQSCPESPVSFPALGISWPFPVVVCRGYKAGSGHCVKVFQWHVQFLLLTLSLAYLRSKRFPVWVKLFSQERAPAAVLSGQRQQSRSYVAILFFPNLGLIEPTVKLSNAICEVIHPLPSSDVTGGNALAMTPL